MSQEQRHSYLEGSMDRLLEDHPVVVVALGASAWAGFAMFNAFHARRAFQEGYQREAIKGSVVAAASGAVAVVVAGSGFGSENPFRFE